MITWAPASMCWRRVPTPVIPDAGPTYDAPAIFSPEDGIAGEVPSLPPALVLGVDEGLSETVARRAERLAPDLPTAFEYHRLSARVGFVSVQDLGVGAPAAAIATEKAVAGGAVAVVLLASAGALQPSTPVDAALLPTRAVRDEGASYHYLPADEPVTSTAGLVDDLGTVLVDAGVETRRGPVWSTSALFRETVPQVERYRDEGFVSVDMESAAVWAVATYRGVDAATVHAVGSVVPTGRTAQDDREEGADPPSEPDATERLPALLDPTVRALESYVEERR